ncbi:putative ribosome-binding factor A-like protein [Leptotrombidium deliense]|uniref:Putative ribosome-binding factor A-like protein n=1 Tax=Leptotrombidium deliense TaxID=299467 RepID=A0A443SDG9_9ACAR|nr:putative ribosome-binding factor A-like protein [Leptotrombidium deliense]
MARVARVTCVTLTQKRFVWKFADQNERMSRFMNRMLKDQSTKIERVFNPSEIVSKGIPNRNFEGNTKALKRRQQMLNKNFMETISEILSSTSFGQELRDLNVVLTQVEISRDYTVLNIFWNTTIAEMTDDEILAISKKLQFFTGKLNKMVQEKNFMQVLPIMRFVFDRETFAKKEVEHLLNKADMGSTFSPTDPTSLETPSERLTSKKGKYKTDVSTYIKEGEDIKYTPEPIVPTFLCPPDMHLNALGLDYRTLINKVLFFMKKSRAEHRNFNAVADPLPPADWVAPPILHAPPDFEESESERVKTAQRVKDMQMFIIENRKKRERLKKQAIKETEERFQLVTEQLDEAMENYMKRMYHDQPDYEDYDEQQ